MRFVKLLIISITILYLFSFILVQANQNEIDEVFDQSVEDWMNRYDIPGVGVSIIEEGTIIYTNTFGYANVEEEVLLTQDSILRTESISKTITAYLVMILVDQDVLSLDTPIKNYIDIDVPDDVTLHMLLTHQSGLAIGPFSLHYSPYEEMPSLRAHLIDTISFVNEPGETFSYSNVGYNLIQYVIESVTNKTFNEVVKQYIFDPYSITDASFEYNPDLQELYAMGYDINNKAIPPYVYPDKSSGGLFTDLDALTNIIQKILTSDDVLPQEKQYMMYDIYAKTKGEYSFVSDGYGYGHFIQSGDNMSVFHGGQGHGWMAFYYAYPDDQNAIIIITNSQRSYPMISGLIDLFSKEMGYDDSRMSVIADGLPYATGFVFVIAFALGFIAISTFKRNIEIETLNLRKEIVKIVVIIVLLAFSLYLWLTPYIFIQVLYPKQYEVLRLVISIFTVIYTVFSVYKMFNRKSVNE